MRLKIHHTTRYRYEIPATYAIQVLRLSPRDHKGQYVCDWRLDINADCRLEAIPDAYGNRTHSFSVDGPIEDLSISVIGEVETNDTSGIVSGTRERLPKALYLRETSLTEPNSELQTFAADMTSSPGQDLLARVHALNGGIHKAVRFDVSATETTTTAADAFSHRNGVCQDLAHIFITCCRQLDIPARYVGGYMFRSDGENQQNAGHAWAEAWIDNIGWVAFDPAHGLCPDDAYVRVAVGLDFLAASPIRGVRYGGIGESMEVSVQIEDLSAERVAS